MTWGAIVAFVLFVVAVITAFKTAVIVPQQNAYVIQSLGKYSRTLDAGFHFLIPFVESVAYKHSLKEEAIDIPEQICITSDNVQVGVDGVIYLKVLNPERASYGISDYTYAVIQLTQTTLRSEMGKLELDRTFEARTAVNGSVVQEVDKASESWGVKVLRYEIKNIRPPNDVLAAMEKQMRAEREKRALILSSEGDRDSKINAAEGEKQRVIKESEAQQQRQVNEARGQSDAILQVAKATAEGLVMVGKAIRQEGGEEAMRLRVAEQYVEQFGRIAKSSNTLVIPADVSSVAGMVALASNIVGATNGGSSSAVAAKPVRS